jgi:tripartite-type tricarboxylate transporter receptor subunit TctC
MARSGFLFACLLVLLAGDALAQRFPSKPITLLCSCPPDSTVEKFLSALGPIASKYLGQSVITDGSRDNLIVGLEKFARTAPPDGYTLSILLEPAFRLPHMQPRKASWNPTKDFTYIIGLARSTYGVLVKSDSRFKTIHDLIDYAKANPGALSYGAGQRGTTTHLAMEQLGLKAGVRFLHVPGSFAQSAKALIDGRVMAISEGSAWGPYVEAGTFRLLVTFGERRSRWNAPTALELGLDILSYAPFGIVGPKGIDPKVTILLHDAFNRTLDDPDYAQLLARFDMVDWYKSSEDYADWAIDQFRFQRALLERTIGIGAR